MQINFALLPNISLSILFFAPDALSPQWGALRKTSPDSHIIAHDVGVWALRL